jgi:hypothetical protein
VGEERCDSLTARLAYWTIFNRAHK